MSCVVQELKVRKATLVMRLVEKRIGDANFKKVPQHCPTDFHKTQPSCRVFDNLAMMTLLPLLLPPLYFSLCVFHFEKVPAEPAHRSLCIESHGRYGGRQYMVVVLVWTRY